MHEYLERNPDLISLHFLCPCNYVCIGPLEFLNLQEGANLLRYLWVLLELS
jgi:hypothetical protein